MLILSQILRHPAERIAIIDAEGEHSYGSVVGQARRLAGALKAKLEAPETSATSYDRIRVAFLAGHSVSSVAALLAIWLADAVAVPLNRFMPLPEWEWRLQVLDIDLLMYTPELQAEAHYLAHSSKVQIFSSNQSFHEEIPVATEGQGESALILFSNRVDSCPLPVVHTHGSLAAQTQTIFHTWQWQPEDHLLNVLPLSNYHGLICGLLGAMAAGCCCELMGAFKVDRVWERLASGEITIFPAVPTMYQYLIDAWSRQDTERQASWSSGARQVRQAIVSPQPLSLPICRQWEKIVGAPLYFKYGTAECAMVLHNILGSEDLHGVSGFPVPGVSLRLVDSNGHETEDSLGELELRSSQLFSEYFGKETFCHEYFNHGWFRTGLLAIRDGNLFQLQGHRNLDLIDTGGYKVSAGDIESVLKDYPGIRECAVLGVPCNHLGETICAFIVEDDQPVVLPELKEWLTPLLPSYMVPARLEVLSRLPRDELGTINKQLLKRKLF